MKKVKGYKAFDKDLKCREFQFKVGKTYTHKGAITLCEKGFHFCLEANDVFNYYIFAPETRVCEIEALGDVAGEGDKRVTNKIKILKEISRLELLTIINMGKENTGRANSGNRNSGDCNSGHYNSGNRNSGNYNSGDYNSGNYNSGNRNSGHYNSGYRNSGHRNSGDYNSGNRNSGDCNSGHYNSGNRNSGFFNTDEPTLRLFNKQTKIKRDDPRIQAVLYLGPELTEWVAFSNMTDEEKKANPKAETTQGFNKTIPYKEAWLTFWVKATEETRKKFLELPEFNAKLFLEITGIDVKKKY
jgi:hypothetical protein